MSLPRWLPSPIAIFVVTIVAVMYAVFLNKGPWDSDYYWHVTTGQLLAEGQFPRTDPFSFTWGGMPWTLHEWVGELLIYRLVDGLGYVGAVRVFAVVPAIAVAIIAVALHRLGLRMVAVVAATSLAGFLVIAYATMRPQALSWVMMAILVAWLLHLRPDRWRQVLAVGPFFVVWANLHGLWVIGVLVLVAYAVMSLLGMTPMSGARRWAVAAVPLALLGTAFTPEGVGLLTYPLRYIDGGDWGMENITEWQSPNFHDPAHVPFLAVMGATAIFSRWRVPWWLSLLAFMGIAMTLLALRNGPLAALLAAPAIAIGMDAALTDWRGPPREHSPRVAGQRRILEIGMAAIVAVAGLLIFLPPSLEERIQASIERELPVQGVELLIERVPDGRIVAEYGWGGYVIGMMYELGARVAVDGRNDMYDDAILTDYGHVRDADPGWERIADRWEADALIFPPYRAITKGPALTAGWCEVYRDENEVVYLRSTDASIGGTCPPPGGGTARP